MKLADKLVKLRKEKGISQEELASMLEVSRQAISRWEMGSTLPDINNIIKLSDIFQVSVDSLVRDERVLEKYNIMDLLKNISNKGDITLVLSPIFIGIGIYLMRRYDFFLLGFLFISLGLICFVLTFYFYKKDSY